MRFPIFSNAKFAYITSSSSSSYSFVYLSANYSNPQFPLIVLISRERLPSLRFVSSSIDVKSCGENDGWSVTRSSKIALIRKTLPSLIDVCLHVRVGALPLPRKRTFPLYLHTIPSAVRVRWLLLVDSFFA